MLPKPPQQPLKENRKVLPHPRPSKKILQRLSQDFFSSTFIGVVLGHLIHGIPISVLSGFGVVALLGVLVNDGLVFISSFNINIKDGKRKNILY